jgi:uroporphyrinogen decarboxylase
MTSRERFQAAINHREPDRVPIDTGQDLHNGLHEVAYKNLLSYLGEEDEIVRYDHMQHLAVVKESVLARLHVDTRYIFCNAPAGFTFQRNEDGSWADEWQVIRNTCGYYDEAVGHPLVEIDKTKLDTYRFPDPRDPARFEGLKEKARSLEQNTDYALIAGNPATLFFLSSELVGFQEYMEKILTDTPLIEELLDKLLEFWIEFFDAYLAEIGEYVDMVWMGDDWGMQDGPIMNPKLFRRIFKERYRTLISSIKKNHDIKVALHSCGSVMWVLEDLADAGFDVLHPLQGDAGQNADPEELKKRFGNDLVFYSNLRNQSVIPHGTPEEVREEVKYKLKHLAPGGGYIVSGGHNIQADVPPENIVALFDTAEEFGRYPISL